MPAFNFSLLFTSQCMAWQWRNTLALGMTEGNSGMNANDQISLAVWLLECAASSGSITVARFSIQAIDDMENWFIILLQKLKHTSICEKHDLAHAS